MQDLNASAVSEILAAARHPQIQQVNLAQLQQQALPLLLIPEGYTHELRTDLEKFLPAPLRKQGQFNLDDADSFIWYAKEHGSPSDCRIYIEADYAAGKVLFTAVINDHSQGCASWRDHRAVFKPIASEEWKRWFKCDKTQMNQIEFASFIEDNLGDICQGDKTPSGSQMLEMALTFEENSEKRFKSATRLQSGGISMEYVDQEDDATRQRMQMFERFSLGVAPFLNGQAYRLEARLKYRIRDGKLALWYELVRPDKVLEDATRALIGKIQTEAGFPILFGSPYTRA